MNVIHMFICMKYVYVYMMACPSSLRFMGWLRLGGSLKLLVSFAKEPYKRDYILQKRRVILRSLLIVATPYLFMCLYMSYVCYIHVYM